MPQRPAAVGESRNQSPLRSLLQVNIAEVGGLLAGSVLALRATGERF